MIAALNNSTPACKDCPLRRRVQHCCSKTEFLKRGEEDKLRKALRKRDPKTHPVCSTNLAEQFKRVSLALKQYQIYKGFGSWPSGCLGFNDLKVSTATFWLLFRQIENEYNARKLKEAEDGRNKGTHRY